MTEFGRANPPRLSDLYTLGKTARLCRLFSSVSAPLADDVCSLTKWVRANMSEDCLPCICKLFAPCPSFDGVAMLKDAASRSVAFVEDAHFLLGCACVAQKADLKEACEHFVVAGAGGNDEAKWCAVRCAFDHNIEECDERIFDWCVQFIKAEKSYFKDAARTLLCRMGQQKNEKAMARLLLLSVKNDPENQFEKLWRGLSRETAGCKEIVSLMTRPEEKKALRQYAQHKDTKVRARAKYLLGYAGFFESCLEPLQQAERVITMPDERVTALLKAGEQALGEIKWAVGQHIGSPEDLATVALGLGDLYFRTGHIDDAARLLTVSLKHREDESVRLLWAKSVAHSTQPAKDDLERAVKLIEKSANAGEPDSQALCGEFLLKGIHGFKKDPARAYELLSSYAQSFPDCPVGAFNLLNLLMEYGGQGRGTGYDYEQMYRLAKTAARNKDYDQPGVQMAGAVAALKIGKVAEAEEVFAKFPDAISVKLCRGVHLIESSQRETGQQQAEMVKQAVASFEDMFVRFLGCVTNELYFHFCFSHDSVQQIRQACMKHPDYGHDPALQAIPEFLDSLPTPEHGSCYTPLLGAFERAAAGGYAHAHLLLARAYQTGQIVPVDKEKACAHLEAYLNACTSGAVPMTEQVFAQLRIIAKGDDELAVRGGYYLAEKLFASQQEGEQPSTDEASLFALAAARVLTTLDRAAQQRMLNRLDQSNMYPLIKALALSGHVQAGQAFATMAMVQVKIVGPTHENVAEALDGLQRAYIGGTLDVKTLVDASIAIGNACLERLPEAVSVCIEKMSAARPTVIPARFLQALYDLRHAKDATHGREFYIKRGLAALHELTDVQKYVPACTMLGALYAPDFKVMSYEQAWERATHNREKSLGYLQWSVHKGDAKAADLLACLNVGSGRRYLEAKSKKMLQDLKSKGVAPHILLQCQAQQLVAKGKLEAGVACFQKVIDDASLPPIVRVGAAVQAALFSVAPEGEPNHVLACKMLLKALELGVVINGKLTGTEGESFKCALTVLSTAAANNVGLARVVALIKARLAALNCTDCE